MARSAVAEDYGCRGARSWGIVPPLMSDERTPPPPPTCAECGAVIGVYEPIVARLGDGTVVQTSLAAEPELERGEWSRYHRECYARSLAD